MIPRRGWASAVGEFLTRWPLGRTVPLAILLSGVLAALLGALAHTGLDRGRELADAKQVRQLSVATAAMHIARHLRDGDTPAAARRLATLREDPQVVEIALIDDQYRLIETPGQTLEALDFQRFPGLTTTALQTPEPKLLGDDRFALMLEPVKFSDTAARPIPEAWLLVRQDLTPLLASASRLRYQRALVSAGFSILCGLALWVFFDRVFSRRLAALKAGFEKVSAGELGVRVALSGNDELTDITRAFNRTMSRQEVDRARLMLREQDLRQRNASLQALRMAVDHHAIVSVADLKGDIRFVNDKFCEVSGYSREDLLGQNHRLLKSFTHGDAFYTDLWHTVSSGKVWRGLIQNRRRSGELYWVQSTIVPVFDDEGAIHQYLSIRTDVTERERQRRGLEMLAEADAGQDLLDRIVEAVCLGLGARWAGIGRFIPDQETVDVMAYWEDGMPSTGFRLAVANTPFASPLVAGEVLRVASGVSARFHLPTRFHGAGAESYRAFPITGQDGQTLGLVWVLDDKPGSGHEDDEVLLALAARRAGGEFMRMLTSRVLDEQRERLGAVVEGARLAVWDWDIVADVLHFNERFATMLGYAPEDFNNVTTAWSGLIHPDDYTMATEAVAAHKNGLTPSYTTEHRLRAKDGSWVWVLDRGRVTERDAQGQPLRMAGVHVDITERKLAELEVRDERARFEMLIRAGNVGFWEWDLVAARTDVTSAVADLLDVAPGGQRDVKEWLKLIHPEDYDRFILAGQKHLKGETPYFSMEARFRAHDGWRWQLVNGQVVARGEDGRARRLVGTHLDVTQLRLAEASGRDAAQRLQVTVEAADLGVWEWDRETGKLETNAWLERTLGFRPAEQAGREGWLLGWLEGEERERFNRFIADKLDAADELLQVETRIRDVAGHWKWINHRGRVTERDPSGRALRLSGVNVDITARKEAEESLKVEQERLARVVAAARLGLWDLDLLNGRTVVNDWVLELIGEARPDRAFERAEWATYFHPDDLPAMEAALDAHCAGITPFFEAEMRVRMANGQWLWIHSSGQVAARDSAGRPVRAAGVFQDVAARREAVSALETSEAKLRTVVEHSPVGIFLSDPAGTIIYVNPLLCELVGRSADACLNETWTMLLDEGPRAQISAGWCAFLDAPEGTYEVEYRFERAPSGLRVVRVQVAAIRLDGRVIGLVGAFNDLTDWTRTADERERLQRELQQAQKMDALGQLTGGIAHDFNNILASILGYVSLAQTILPPEGTERIANYLAAVMSAGERARELVAKMLEFSRNAPREDLQPVDPAPLIDEVARMMKAIIPSSMKLVVHHAAAPIFALLDPSDLHQLLVNLIVNARDALGPHGQIDVRLLSPHRVRGVCSGCHGSVNGHYLVIEVEDNGSGIEPDVLSRIFDPFFSTKIAGKGTGMGLSVVHGILHRGRGHVLVESRPGQGTRFRLLFPPAPVSSSDTPAQKVALAEAPRGQGQRILVVDDEPLVASYLSELFSLNGYAVDTAADGVEALERIDKGDQRYGLLLTDQTMPRMTGTELITRLRSVQPDLPIILCTGYSDAVDEQGALALGIREFVRKPVAPDALLRSVAAVMGSVAS